MNATPGRTGNIGGGRGSDKGRGLPDCQMGDQGPGGSLGVSAGAAGGGASAALSMLVWQLASGSHGPSLSGSSGNSAKAQVGVDCGTVATAFHPTGPSAWPDALNVGSPRNGRAGADHDGCSLLWQAARGEARFFRIFNGSVALGARDSRAMVNRWERPIPSRLRCWILWAGLRLIARRLQP